MNNSSEPAAADHKYRDYIVFLLYGILIVMFGVININISSEISFFIFYMLPLAAASFHLDKKKAYTLAFLAVAVWLTANLIAGPNYTNRSIIIWNLFVRIIMFFGLIRISLHIQSIVERYRQTSLALEAALHQVRTMQGTHLVCDTCGLIATQDKRWIPPLQFIQENSESSFHSCICPSCFERNNKVKAQLGE